MTAYQQSFRHFWIIIRNRDETTTHHVDKSQRPVAKVSSDWDNPPLDFLLIPPTVVRHYLRFMVESPREQRSVSAPALRMVSTALALTLALSLSCTKTRPVDPNFPMITASPNSLEFSVVAGGQTPPFQRIAVTNAGGGTLSFAVSKHSAWLQADYRGTAPDTIEVFVYTLGMSSGIYRDTLVIASTQAANSPFRVTVSVEVLPGISVLPRLVVRSAYKNGPAVMPETLEVTSEGGGPKVYKIAPTPEWLRTDYPVGLATEKIALGFNIENVAAGVYSHQLVISSGEAANRETSTLCSLTVESWRRRFESNNYTLTGISFSSQDTGWAAGYLRVFEGVQASLFVTIDGGLTWQLTSVPQMGAIADLAITEDGRLWMPGDTGQLLTTGAGGFLVKSLPTRENLTGIAFSCEDTGWITGENGVLIRSIDRGLTWVQQPPPTMQSLNAVAFINSRTGWAVGAKGTVIATSDGGQRWQSAVPGPAVELRDIEISDVGSVWVVGSAGTILYRSWSGVKWIEIPSGVTEDLRKIAFAGPDYGWIVGSNGSILHTSDGGLTWQRQTSGTNQQLYALFPRDSARAFVAGIDALILDTYCGGE